jgi:site-specific DNA-cytosine methylase
MKTFVEIHSDLGGARLALKRRGYTSIGSINWEELIDYHWEFSTEDAYKNKNFTIPCDILVIQFPTHDTVSGFWSLRGEWISARYVATKIRKIMIAYNPKKIIFIGRNNVMIEGNGSAFAEILMMLCDHDYESCWIRLNLASIGIPQDASRIAIVGMKKSSPHSSIAKRLPLIILSSILKINENIFLLDEKQSISKIIEDRKPKIGSSAPTRSNPFGRYGISHSGYLENIRVIPSKALFTTSTSSPKFTIFGDNGPFGSQDIRSVRFISRQGERSLQLKKAGLAHSVGPSISAWPLFAFKEGADNTPFSNVFFNWNSKFDDYQVGRLTPEKTLLLFGEDTSLLSSGLSRVASSMSAKYKMVSATVAPKLIDLLVDAIEHTVIRQTEGDRSEIH